MAHLRREGEIRLSCDASFLQIGLFDPKLTVVDHESATVKGVDVASEEWEGLPRENRNIGRLYEAFATGEGAENLVGFEKAVVRHRFLDEVFRASEEKSVGQYKQEY
jgi:hypothetical protein